MSMVLPLSSTRFLRVQNLPITLCTPIWRMRYFRSDFRSRAAHLAQKLPPPNRFSMRSVAGASPHHSHSPRAGGAADGGFDCAALFAALVFAVFFSAALRFAFFSSGVGGSG